MAYQDDILIALRRITRAIDLHSRQLMKASGLTAPQLVVLNALNKNGDMTPSCIAREVSLSQATVTAILDRLQKQELVTRERSQDDRRQVLVHLTAKARTSLEQAPELLQSGFLREFGQLAEWEQLMMISALQRIAELMDAEDIDAGPILDTGQIDRPGSEP